VLSLLTGSITCEGDLCKDNRGGGDGGGKSDLCEGNRGGGDGGLVEGDRGGGDGDGNRVDGNRGGGDGDGNRVDGVGNRGGGDGEGNRVEGDRVEDDEGKGDVASSCLSGPHHAEPILLKTARNYFAIDDLQQKGAKKVLK
jgi:hypothetical protein